MKSLPFSVSKGFSILRLGRFIVVLLVPAATLAAPASDRLSATRIDADALKHDDRRLVSVFEGSVRVSKGSLLMRGDRLELRRMPDGSSRFTLTGSPASFRQRRTPSNEWIQGQAVRIDYDSASEISVLGGTALLTRLIGEVEIDGVTGERLVYNGVAETYIAEHLSDPSKRATMSIRPDLGSRSSTENR